MTTSPRAPFTASENGRLDDRIVRLLGSVAGHVAFNGLRRALSAHPESLSRALRRLERGGTVLHDERGYTLVEGSPEMPTSEPPVWRSVAQVEVPLGVSREALLGQFAGKWMGRLRWVGGYDHPTEPLLIWSVEGTPGHVVLAIDGRTLRVGVEEPTPGSSEALVAAARELFTYGLSRIVRLDRALVPPVQGFELGTDGPDFGEN